MAWGLLALSGLNLPCLAHATFIVISEGMYGSTNLKSQTTAGTTDIFGGFVGAASVGKKPSWWVGFRGNYVNGTVTANDGAATATVSGMEWGPHLAFVLGKTRSWQFHFSYIVYARAQLAENGSTLGTVTGSGYQMGVALAPAITSHINAGMHIQYRAISYGEIRTPANTAADVAYGRTSIMPSLFMSIAFDP
jgi:hypothetical protein